MVVVADEGQDTRRTEQGLPSEVAATEPLSVSAGESIQHAAQLMSEHGVSHLVVLDAANGHPSGILSTLDVAALYANRNGDPV